MIDIYDLTAEQLADLINDLAFTLTQGDDNLIQVSNVARETFARHELNGVGEALEEVAERVRELDLGRRGQ